EHAIKINPGGINGPPKIAVLGYDSEKKFSAHIIDENLLEEHRGMIDATKQQLRTFLDNYRSGTGLNIPDIPSPM
ncbi:MAG: hypothetical protein ABH878_05560, partial [bacterium]